MSAMLDSLLDSERRSQCAVHDSLGARDRLPQRHVPSEPDPIERAQSSTYAARQAIKAIRAKSPREYAELLSCIQAELAKGGPHLSEDEIAADEALTDCIYFLEQQALRSE